MGKPKSLYSWDYNQEKNRIEIRDEGAGHYMSVTNNAETVLDEIREKVGDNIENIKIIYKDTDGNWDTMIPKWVNGKCIDIHFTFGTE